VLDRGRSLPLDFDPSAPEPPPLEGSRQSVCVRDLSWHSREPVLLSAAFTRNYMGNVSNVARHDWKGLTKTSGALEDWVEKQKLEGAEAPRQPTSRFPGHFYGEDGEDDDELDDGWL